MQNITVDQIEEVAGSRFMLKIPLNTRYEMIFCFQCILETLFIEIDKDQFARKQNIIIGVIYRPPDTDIKEFNDHILKCLAQIKAEKKLHFC